MLKTKFKGVRELKEDEVRYYLRALVYYATGRPHDAHVFPREQKKAEMRIKSQQK